MTQFPALFEPFRLKHLRLRNRIISTAHAPAYAEGGRPLERYQRYHEEKARGGLAMTMFGGASAVAPDSAPGFGGLNLADDGIVPDLRRFADRIHAAGAALMCQISHAGRRTSWSSAAWLPTIAPSPIREPVHRSFPKPMEDHDFARVATAFAAAARRCRDGGLDGCEILVAGHLIGQFLTPYANSRRDGYGGSIENRARFCLDVLAETRRAVGPDFIVGIRLTADELIDGGIREDDAIAFARIVAASGHADFLNVNGGNNWTNVGLAYAIPNMAFPLAPHLHLAGVIRRATGLPVFHAGRITDFATANRAVGEGMVDLVAMTRAHMADPHMVRKLQAGDAHRIRPCVGANFCIDRIYAGGDALCLHNPAMGREGLLSHDIGLSPGPKRKVAIVGAGPAGLEAARVAALRGHAVVVFEAADRPGGQLLLAAKAGWRKEMGRIAEWLAQEARIAGADIRYGKRAEAPDVLAEAPEVVIVASGGRPNTMIVPGAEHAVGPSDILSGRVAPGSSVLVYDDNGDHQGPSVAEFLLDRGAAVELATPDRQAFSFLGATNSALHLRNLYRAGATITVDRRLATIAREGNRLAVTLRNEYADIAERRTVDQVVIENGTLPVDDLYWALREGSTNLGEIDQDAFMKVRPQAIATNPAGRYQLFRIGDAVASRNVHAALYDAIRLCSAL